MRQHTSTGCPAVIRILCWMDNVIHLENDQIHTDDRAPVDDAAAVWRAVSSSVVTLLEVSEQRRCIRGAGGRPGWGTGGRGEEVASERGWSERRGGVLLDGSWFGQTSTEAGVLRSHSEFRGLKTGQPCKRSKNNCLSSGITLTLRL